MHNDVIRHVCFKYGIQPGHLKIVTALGSTPEAQQKITNAFPTAIGLCYGLSIDVESVIPTNGTTRNIRLVDALEMFVSIKVEATDLVSWLRLDNLIFVNANVTQATNNPNRYFPVFMPGAINWEQSFYQNPSAAGADRSVSLNFWYLDPDSLTFLINKKIIDPFRSDKYVRK